MVAAELNDTGVIAGYDAIVAQSELTNELPRYTLWWGPFTQSVSETILEAAQTGMSGDDAIDLSAESWNDLRSEYE